MHMAPLYHGALWAADSEMAANASAEVGQITTATLRACPKLLGEDSWRAENDSVCMFRTAG